MLVYNGEMTRDQQIFDQLDRLQRGARVSNSPQNAYWDESSAGYSAHDISAPRYEHEQREYGGRQPEEYDYAAELVALDSFDERLLHQPDLNARHGQATLDRARHSLPPQMDSHTSMVNHDMRDAPAFQRASDAGHSDLSRFALDPEQHAASSSSPLRQVLPSSPTFQASQRRVEPLGHGRHSYSMESQATLGQLYGTLHYEPVTGEQLEAEEMSALPPRIPSFDCHRDPSPYSRDATQIRPKIPGQSSLPVVQGIRLVSTRSLPDRLRQVFPFPLFNAVQSKTFETLFNTNDNFVLSAPTGSGKTAVLELAVCRLVSTFASGTFKIIYQAPTKSLCAERQRDWQAKFAPLGLSCAELTGDTENANLRNVQQAEIIITTPEKWDSMTRKWKDHQRLMQMVKLFLIDEVHILKEERGATLEAVVSRMKSVGSDVRFIALSATVPNSEDIATWLGKDPMNPHIPASRERFGEEFLPVRLKKHVVGYASNSNDFAFDMTLTGKLPEVISKYSQRKPIMVFCFTRKSCDATARALANWWSTKSPRDRYWTAPHKRLEVSDRSLRDTISSGVASHHAGMTSQDRSVVENAYLEGEVNVICCTSTLAVGVNLPCHMVIIKNTATYQGASCCKEYSDLEIMQMLGRAGRPQFDDSAVAVIMTRSQRVQYYEKMISGHEILESCLHRNLIDHLNAEIGLGTITSPSSAKKWLSGTFLYVRLKENPEHYKIDGDTTSCNLNERLETICTNGISLLKELDLVTETAKLRCTEFGDAMARYYIQFDSMKTIMELPTQSKVSEILSAVAKAAEFRDIRFRPGEKPVYKDLNKNGSIKFPIPVNLDLTAHKVSLILQAVLGAVDIPTDDAKHLHEFNTSRAAIFQHATRLIRCIVDCKLYLEDAVTTRNALMLARSLGAQVWDDSPLSMKQLEKIGLVFVRKLVSAGINSIEELENVDAHRIEQACSRNPPFGSEMQSRAKGFPKLRISLKTVGDPVIKKDEHVTVKIKAEIGFLNESVPELFQRRPVYVCLLAETSDGHKVHFARISAKKLSKGQDVLFSANLVEPSHSIRAYVMCDEIAGTMRHAILKPKIPEVAFPPRKADTSASSQPPATSVAPNTAKRRATAAPSWTAEANDYDEFADPDLDDDDFANVEMSGFVDIDEFNDNVTDQPKKKRKVENLASVHQDWEPRQLANGKWACNHTCKNKNTCKHLCCRDGLDKKPKPPKAKDSRSEPAELVIDPKQRQLNMAVSKKVPSVSQSARSTDIVRYKPQPKSNTGHRATESKEVRDLNRLHNSIKSHTPQVPKLASGAVGSLSNPVLQNKPSGRLSFAEAARAAEEESISDCGTNVWDSNDLPDVDEFVAQSDARRASLAQFDDDLDFDFDSAEFDYLDNAVQDLGHEEASDDDKLVDFSPVDHLHQAGNKQEANGITKEERASEHRHPDCLKTQAAGTAQVDKKARLVVGTSTDPPSAAPDVGSDTTNFPQSGPEAIPLSNVEDPTALPDEGDEFDWFRKTFGDDMFNLVE